MCVDLICGWDLLSDSRHVYSFNLLSILKQNRDMCILSDSQPESSPDPQTESPNFDSDGYHKSVSR